MNSSIVEYFNQFEAHKAGVQWLSSVLGFEAAGLVAFVIFLVADIVIVSVMATIGGLGTYAERKISADIQMRQ